MKKPLGNRVLLKMENQPPIIGGIYVPGADIYVPNIGTVVQLGTGKEDDDGNIIPFKVKIGDKVVVVNTDDKIKVRLSNEDYQIFRQDEIVATIED